MAEGFVNGLLCTPGIYIPAPYEDYIFTKNDTFQIPVGARYVQISCIGGGGGGGSHTFATAGGAGGGGSGYIVHGKKQACTPLTTLTITVGAGGAGGVGGYGGNPGVTGGSSSVKGTGITTITAAGGRYGRQAGGTYFGQGGNGGHGGGGGGQGGDNCGAGGNGANALGGAQGADMGIMQVFRLRCGGGSYTSPGTTTEMNSAQDNGGKSASNLATLYLFSDTAAAKKYYVGKGGDGGRGNPDLAWENMGWGGNGGAPQGMTGTPRGMGGNGASFSEAFVNGFAGTDGIVGIRVYYTEQ